jgi:hypothetical protein
MSPLLFFDVETAPDDNRRALWAAKQQEAEQAGKEFAPALVPEFCRVVALGWAVGDEPAHSLVVGTVRPVQTTPPVREITETDVLARFWQLVSSQPRPMVVGFNILNFDLPVLFVRSALLGVRPSRLFDRRPWGTDCIDLCEIRRHEGRGGKLKDLARYYGFTVAEPDVDGAQVEQLIATDPAKVGRYVESDVAITRQLYHFYKGYFVPNAG